jgi:hypothetical protein
MKTVTSKTRVPSNGEPITLSPSRIENIQAVQLETKRLRIKIQGTSTLVTHAWSEKAKGLMLGKQKGEASKGKSKKDPVEDFKNSLYRLPDGQGFGIPATSLKSAAVTAANDVELQKTQMRRAFHVLGDMVKIDAPAITEPITPEDIEYAKDIVFEHQHGASMRQDMVRLSLGVADIRFRAQFPIWSITFDVEYNSRVITASQLVNLFNVAGFGVGLCEHRPEKSGSWGRFEVC